LQYPPHQVCPSTIAIAHALRLPLLWLPGRFQRGSFRTLFEALQLQECNLDTPAEYDTFTPPIFPTAAGSLYVDATAGSDTNSGTEGSPFKSIVAAVAASKAGAIFPSFPAILQRLLTFATFADRLLLLPTLSPTALVAW
jgi:hypothetical protein